MESKVTSEETFELNYDNAVRVARAIDEYIAYRPYLKQVRGIPEPVILTLRRDLKGWLKTHRPVYSPE